VAVFVRPHDVQINRHRNALCAIPARVESVAGAGPVVRVSLVRLDDGSPIEAEISHARQAELNLVPKDLVAIGFSHFGVYEAPSYEI
jgi:ABC-type sulfate/molybdate transport systems ATPase subunit